MPHSDVISGKIRLFSGDGQGVRIWILTFFVVHRLTKAEHTLINYLSAIEFCPYLSSVQAWTVVETHQALGF
jgi:hypothetical protein